MTRPNTRRAGHAATRSQNKSKTGAKMEFSDNYLVLKWNGDSSPVEVGEPDDFLYEYNGSIYSLDEYDNETTVGRFRAFYVDLDASGMSAYDTLDGSQETIAFYPPLFDQRTDDYKES